MKHDVSYNLFTAKDVAKLLGINSNMLFHWVQTKGLMKPTVRGIGRGQKNYFSLEDLATLLLIKVLSGYKMDLWQIKSIIADFTHPNPTVVSEVRNEEPGVGMVLCDENGKGYPYKDTGPINIWQVYKKGKALFDKFGFFMTLGGTFDGEVSYLRGINFRINLIISQRALGGKPSPISVLAISLLGIIKEIEKRTGLAF